MTIQKNNRIIHTINFAVDFSGLLSSFRHTDVLTAVRRFLLYKDWNAFWLAELITAAVAFAVYRRAAEKNTDGSSR